MAVTRPPEPTVMPAPAFFWIRFACTVQRSAASWFTTPSLLLSPAEPKFCTVKKLTVTSVALPPNAYRLRLRPSRIAPGAPTKVSPSCGITWL